MYIEYLKNVTENNSFEGSGPWRFLKFDNLTNEIFSFENCLKFLIPFTKKTLHPLPPILMSNTPYVKNMYCTAVISTSFFLLYAYMDSLILFFFIFNSRSQKYLYRNLSQSY